MQGTWHFPNTEPLLATTYHRLTISSQEDNHYLTPEDALHGQLCRASTVIRIPEC